MDSTSLLKCKECGGYLYNGNEKIFWKCSCGNMQCGKSEDYYRNNIPANNLQTQYGANRNKEKLKIKYVFPISLVFVLFIVGISLFVGIFVLDSLQKSYRKCTISK